jgi:GAF domain-containing protein
VAADRGRLERDAVSLLAGIAVRAEAGRRIHGDSARAVLRSIVEATVALFDAEAASIALYDAASDRLVFEVAAGEQGQGVIGLSIAPDQGIAGYVFQSGQALALSDVERDPRFGRAVAEQTAYLPRSIVAVPLVSDERTIGVLEVLDKRTATAFSLRDIELAGIFAQQAATAISATRVERDVASLLGAGLRALAAGEAGGPEAATVDDIVRAAVVDLGRDDESGLWALADAVAVVRSADPAQLELVTDILAALGRQAGRDSRRRRRTRPAAGGAEPR